MANLIIADLGYDRELDNAAAREARGGMNFGFLGGLFAGTESALPSFVQNFYVDYDQTVVQLAPVNFNVIADNGSVAQIGGPVNITNVIGNSSIGLLTGAA